MDGDGLAPPDLLPLLLVAPVSLSVLDRTGAAPELLSSKAAGTGCTCLEYSVATNEGCLPGPCWLSKWGALCFRPEAE